MVARRSYRLIAMQADDAELHVDVMRFFAIVALCLFAILPRTESSPTSLVIQNYSSRSEKLPVMAVPTADHPNSTLTDSILARSLSYSSGGDSTPWDSSSIQQAQKIDSFSEKKEDHKTSSERTHIVENHPIHRTSPSTTLVQPRSNTYQGGIRFLNADTFASAVKNGSITLVYHYKDSSFVFDTYSAVFTPANDIQLQIFGLAASEIPEQFWRSVPKTHKSQETEPKWFITLPSQTLAYLNDFQTTDSGTIVLNEIALPI